MLRSRLRLKTAEIEEACHWLINSLIRMNFWQRQSNCRVTTVAYVRGAYRRQRQTEIRDENHTTRQHDSGEFCARERHSMKRIKFCASTSDSRNLRFDASHSVIFSSTTDTRSQKPADITTRSLDHSWSGLVTTSQNINIARFFAIRFDSASTLE